MPNMLKYSRSDGKNAPCIRSCWMRSIMMTSASATASSTDVDTRDAEPLDARRHSVGGPLTHTSAPSLVSSRTFERSTRLCSRSPTMATFSPSMRCLVLADRERVEQRLRRVLVHAVAGVDDARPADARQQVAGAGRGVAQHDHVGRHRLDVQRGVGERLALEHARGRRPRCSACRRSGASRRSRTTCACACSARRTG